MGLKSGSRNSGLDDSQDTTEPDEDEATATRTESEDGRADMNAVIGESATGTKTGSGQERPTKEALPYKLRRGKVNEGRDQVPFFLRKEVVKKEDNLQNTLKEELGENVYKSDYREAAMVVAQRNPELVAEVLREWGYDLDAI